MVIAMSDYTETTKYYRAYIVIARSGAAGPWQSPEIASSKIPRNDNGGEFYGEDCPFVDFAFCFD